MIFPFRAVFPLSGIPVVTVAIILVCTFLQIIAPKDDLNTRVLNYCFKDKNELSLVTQDYLQEVLDALEKESDVSCPQATLVFLGLDIKALASTKKIGKELIHQVEKHQKKLKETLQVVSYRTFDPKNPTIVSLFSAVFTHGGWSHFLGNMFFLWIFGTVLESLVGASLYAMLFLLAGAGSHLVYLLLAWFNLIDPVPTLGASAAVYGVMAGVYILYPALKVDCLFFFFTLMRVVQFPAKYLIAFYIFFDVIRLPLMSAHGTNFVGHLSGFAFVYFYFKYFYRKE